MGIITLQAGAAARVIDTQPQRAREALFEVESAGRETLAGLRRMLGPLRQAGATQAGAGQTGASPGYQPGSMPGLADIDRLAAATTAAGVRDAAPRQARRQGPGTARHHRLRRGPGRPGPVRTARTLPRSFKIFCDERGRVPA